MGACDGDLERHLACRALRRFDEVDLHDGADVCTARAAAAARQHVVAEERREEVGEAAEVELPGLEAAAAQARVAVAVVERARLRLGEHLVRLDDLAKAVVRIGRVGDVGVQLAGKRAKGLLDLRLGRVAPYSEELVVIALGRRHASQASDQRSS